MGNRNVSIDWIDTGLVGTLAQTVFDQNDNILRARTTTGVTESPAGSGIYVVSVPDTWAGRVVFDDGTDTFDEQFLPLTGGGGTGGGTVIAEGTPTLFSNSFEYIPVISKESELIIRFAAIRNLSTVGAGSGAGTGSTDRGRMFGKVDLSGDTLTISLYKDVARSVEICKATATADDIGEWVEMGTGAQGTHDESARVMVVSLPGDGDRSANFICFPSFADDADVYPDPNSVAALPGYDTGAEGGSEPDLARGLAIYHAKAVKQILTTSLPSAIPHLFGGGALSALVPMDESEISFPDIREIANVDSLREAQAQLVLAMAAGANRHLREYADIADAARERFNELIEEIRAANEPDDTDAADDDEALPGHGGLSFGTFNRG